MSTWVIPVIVSVLGSGGLLGSIYALLKLRPEAGQIVVTSAQGAVILQAGVLDSLNAANERLQRENAAMVARVERWEQRVEERDAELRELRQSVAELKAELARLYRQLNGGGT